LERAFVVLLVKCYHSSDDIRINDYESVHICEKRQLYKSVVSSSTLEYNRRQMYSKTKIVHHKITYTNTLNTSTSYFLSSRPWKKVVKQKAHLATPNAFYSQLINIIMYNINSNILTW